LGIIVINLFPPCCIGLVYNYLAGHVGHSTDDQGAFRALSRGYNQWFSGRLEQLDINVEHPQFCHVRCIMKASMKDKSYKVYILLKRQGQLAAISVSTCKCAAGYV